MPFGEKTLGAEVVLSQQGVYVSLQINRCGLSHVSLQAAVLILHDERVVVAAGNTDL